MMKVMHQELHMMVPQEVKKLTWEMMDMEPLKKSLKVTKMTSKSMLLKANPG